jgi:DnaJ-domain-containing protein 1
MDGTIVSIRQPFWPKESRFMQVPEQAVFTRILLEILQLHPAGLSEYELLQRLRNDERIEFEQSRLDDSHDLFRTHFLLFHQLYKLRTRLRTEQAGDLDIHALKIRLLPWVESSLQALTQPDPLGVYYLDLDNLTGTTRADVDDLLGRFWARYGRYDGRAEALAVLELPTESDAETIRLQYRRLAMQHHPDRGGDQLRLQAINAAMAVLDPRKQ